MFSNSNIGWETERTPHYMCIRRRYPVIPPESRTARTSKSFRPMYLSSYRCVVKSSLICILNKTTVFWVFVTKHNMNDLIFLLSCILSFDRRSSEEVQYPSGWMSCCFDNTVNKYLQTLLKEIKRMEQQLNLCNFMHCLFVGRNDRNSRRIKSVLVNWCNTPESR